MYGFKDLQFAGDYYMEDKHDQRQSQMDSRGGNTEQFILPKRNKKLGKPAKTEYFGQDKYGPNYYTIPVQNRFSENF